MSLAFMGDGKILPNAMLPKVDLTTVSTEIAKVESIKVRLPETSMLFCIILIFSKRLNLKTSESSFKDISKCTPFFCQCYRKK